MAVTVLKTYTNSQDNIPSYLAPCSIILKGLGIGITDLDSPKVKVSTSYLKFLLSKILGSQTFDEEWYFSRNPDVHGAIMAGLVPSGQEHFKTTGFFENRLPYEIPFDPKWYFSHYKDLSQAYSSADHDALKTHFLTTGYFEGRVGVPEMLEDAEKWSGINP